MTEEEKQLIKEGQRLVKGHWFIDLLVFVVMGLWLAFLVYLLVTFGFAVFFILFFTGLPAFLFLIDFIDQNRHKRAEKKNPEAVKAYDEFCDITNILDEL